MRLQKLVGMLGVAAVAVLLSSSWAAAQLNVTGGSGPVTIGTLTFKTSPNVYVHYESDATPGTTYVAGSVHNAGDRAYGVDPDYTGMFVANVPVGTTDPWDAGAPSVAAGSSDDFSTGWVAK
jgi:hypothetical protein